MTEQQPERNEETNEDAQVGHRPGNGFEEVEQTKTTTEEETHKVERPADHPVQDDGGDEPEPDADDD